MESRHSKTCLEKGLLGTIPDEVLQRPPVRIRSAFGDGAAALQVELPKFLADVVREDLGVSADEALVGTQGAT